MTASPTLASQLYGPCWAKPEPLLAIMAGLFVGVNALGGNFHFADPTKGKQQLDEVLRRLFRRLFHDVADSVGDCGLKHHALGLQSGQVHAHELPRFQHVTAIFRLSPSAGISCALLASVARRRLSSKTVCRLVK